MNYTWNKLTVDAIVATLKTTLWEAPFWGQVHFCWGALAIIIHSAAVLCPSTHLSFSIVTLSEVRPASHSHAHLFPHSLPCGCPQHLTLDTWHHLTGCRHTSVHSALLYCAPQMLHSLQIEGKTFQQQKDYTIFIEMLVLSSYLLYCDAPESNRHHLQGLPAYVLLIISCLPSPLDVSSLKAGIFVWSLLYL